jgi:hypothetical protein
MIEQLKMMQIRNRLRHPGIFSMTRPDFETRMRHRTDAQNPIIMAFESDCLLYSRFPRLQDPMGKEMVALPGDADLDSMLIRENGHVLSRSSTALAPMGALGGI